MGLPDLACAHQASPTLQSLNSFLRARRASRQPHHPFAPHSLTQL
jgi:hypothetical protein